MPFRAASVPLSDHGQQRQVPSECLDFLEVGLFDRPETPKDLRRLSDDQPQVRQFERNLFESQERPSLSLVTREDLGTELERRQRNSALHSSLQLDQGQVQVRGIGELRMALFDCPKLDRFPGVAAGRPRGPRGGFGH